MDVCATEKELFKHLGEQIHVESKIISAKFKCVNNSMKFFGLSVIFVFMIFGFWLIRTKY